MPDCYKKMSAKETASYEALVQLLTEHPAALTKVKERADEVSAVFREIDVHIEQHTRVVCPDCITVCCINRHSYYDPQDIVYLSASGEQIPPFTEGIDDAAPCQFLGRQGCMIRRSQRPYRCTWFFCTPLLDHIRSVSARDYRLFISRLQDLTAKREDLAREFVTAVQGIGQGSDALEILISHGLLSLQGYRGK